MGETVFSFSARPKDLNEFKALPESAMTKPEETAALTALALCYYPTDRELSLSMLSFLKGPKELSPMEEQFIRDRFMDKDYVPRSYFDGASPENDYTPTEPYTIRVSDNLHSYEEENYAKIFLTSSGADSPRFVRLRLAKDGKWYLWEQFLLSDIRKPASSDPWA